MKMNDLGQEVARMADEAFEIARTLTGVALDFSVPSLQVIDGLIAAYAAEYDKLSETQKGQVAQRFSCYFLEVARRHMGGTYKWYRDVPQPTLVVGEPRFHLSILAWDRVEGALKGRKDNDLVRYYAALVERVRTAQPGTNAIYC